MKNITVIVAMCKDSGIGFEQTMPWHLREDLQHFKATTKECPIIMGRKTFQSLPALLKGREHVVISQTMTPHHAITVVPSALHALDHVINAERAFIIGGGQVYRDMLVFADQLIVTHIDHMYKCDTFFPEIKPDEWRVEQRTPKVAANGLRYEIVHYQRP